jgi:hypothetical protein
LPLCLGLVAVSVCAEDLVAGAAVRRGTGVALTKGDKSQPPPAPVKVKPGSVRALFFRDAAPAEMSAATGAPTGKKVYALAELPLVLTEPCAATTGGLTFRVEQEGLYRFANLDTKETANVILYRGDAWRLAGHLSRLQVHGWRHDGESLARWTERVRKGRLSISCGNIVRFVAHHLSERGHRSRVVRLFPWRSTTITTTATS